MKYRGRIISATLPVVNSSQASGIWFPPQHMQGVRAGAWPGSSSGSWAGTLSLQGVAGSSGPAYPGTQGQYAALASIPSGTNYSFDSGYHYFDMVPGTYSVRIKGAEGSGTQHGYGADISATITVSQTTRMVALIGNAGSGSYGGGGGTFLAITTGNTYTTATALLVAGGGGGGYTSFHDQLDGGDTSWTPTTRRGNSTDRGDGRGGTYDGGAAFSAVYNPELNPSTEGGQGSTAAQHFVWGGRGGIHTNCGSGAGQQGGFGGGGGSCPGGGGGYYGGKAGGNAPGQYGGGGGTSYRLSSGAIAFIPSWTYVGTNGTTRTATSSLASGSLSITRV
jgi:hypothetical protein